MSEKTGQAARRHFTGGRGGEALSLMLFTAAGLKHLESDFQGRTEKPLQMVWIVRAYH
jgi:hypothetical protein